MSSPIEGTWYNDYGSTVKLFDVGQGVILGLYSSTTGSSGLYLVDGFYSPDVQLARQGEGSPITLNISWRSLEGGTGDPSWNWVSGLAGQLIYNDQGGLEIDLIHTMVAANPFAITNGPTIETGLYSDKLTYKLTKAPRDIQSGPQAASDGKPDIESFKIDGAVTQRWQCVEDPGISFVTNATSDAPTFSGSIIYDGNTTTLMGQFNNEYAPILGPYQAFSLSTTTYDAQAGAVPMAVAFGGWIDTTTGKLSVLEQRATPSTYGSRYMSVRTRQLTFT